MLSPCLRSIGASTTSKGATDSVVPELPANDKNPWLESSTELAHGLDVTEVTDEAETTGLPVPARPAKPPRGPSDA